MNLVIDIGNTRLKYAVYAGNKLLVNEVENHIDNFEIEKILQNHSIVNSIICSVAGIPEKLTTILKAKTAFIDFTSTTPVPLKNLYKSMHTLGSDRLAVAVGAFLLYPGANILAIDTGTCIKYNFISRAGEYMGGGISPGIDMRFKALHNFTHKLPLIEADYNFDSLVGQNTEQSILSGVLNGVVGEMEGVIENYSKQYPHLKTVITGGNHTFFVRRLKSSIFADPFLLFKGLNAIIDFNAHK